MPFDRGDLTCAALLAAAVVALAATLLALPLEGPGSPLMRRPEVRSARILGRRRPMIAIPENVERDLCRAGPWWWGFNAPAGEPPAAPLLRCPQGHMARLTSHQIAANGAVSPSIVCPEEGCSWHVWGRLEGWAIGPRAADPR